MIAKPILVVMDSSIYTVLVPVHSIEHDLPLTTQMIAHSELVYDLSDESYIKCRVAGDKTLGDDTIKNLYGMSKLVTLGEFNYYLKDAFPELKRTRDDKIL